MNSKILLLTALVLILAGSVFNQSSGVTDAEMAALRQKARDARNLVPYRLTTSTFGFPVSYSKIELMRTSVTDYLPPDRSLIVEEYTGMSGRTVRTEVLWIAKTKYLRNKNGVWTAEAPVSMTGHVTPVMTAIDATSEESHKYLGKQNLNGKQHDLYESVILLKFRTATTRAVQVTRRKSWFDQQGLLIKETSEEGIRGHAKLVRRVESEYDYDHPIKIDAPIK